MRVRHLLAIALLVIGLGCETSRPPAEPVHIVVVGTTDHHGWIDGRRTRDGGNETHTGGLPLLSSYVNALREANGGRVLLVDSGDMFQGTLESNMFEGEPVIRAYNAIGYHAAAVGNHEFDYGPIGPKPIPKEPSDNPFGALERNVALAKFPLLSANMTETATGKTPPWAKRYTIADVGGVQVAIIGLSTVSTPNSTMKANVKTLTFGDPVKATVDVAAEARRRGADAVIVIAHIGTRCSSVDDVNDLDKCDLSQESVQYLRALPPGTIDGYFGGHSHARMRHIVNGIPATQAPPLGAEFSTLDLWIDPSASRVTRSELRKHTKVEHGTFEGKTIVPDPRVQAVIDPFLEKVAARKNEKLGVSTTAPFERSGNQESTMANLLTDTMRAWANADIAVIQTGSIRAGLRQGELTYGDIFAVCPFDNLIAVVQMTGAQVETMLANSRPSLMHPSGLRYTMGPPKAQGAARSVTVTLPDGSPLDREKLYSVVLTDYILQGGDGLAELMRSLPPERIRLAEDITLRDAIVDVLKKSGGPLTPKLEGRITVAQ